jgi:hypothetical protein
MRDVGKIEKLSFHEYITWDSFFQSIDPRLVTIGFFESQ